MQASGVRFWVWMGLLLAAVGAAREQVARGQSAAATDFRDTLLLNVNSAATKALGVARDHIRAGQYGAAIDRLVQIAETHRDDVVSAGLRRYVNAPTYCDSLIASLPTEGLKLYRERIDPLVRKAYEAGKAQGDDELLQRVVRQGFASTWGDDALLLLGDRAWERGELSRARSYWQMILPLVEPGGPGVPGDLLRYPDTELDLALVRARLVMCSFAQGNTDRGTRELQGFTRLHPAAEGTLAGRTGKLVQTLEAFAVEAAGWRRPQADAGVSTFGFSPERQRVLPKAVSVGAVQWTNPLRKVFRDQLGRHAALGQPKFLSYFPVVEGRTVFVADDESVSAFDLLTGKPAWPGDDAGDARIYPSVAIDPPEPFADLVAEDAVRTVGVPRFTLTLSEGRLFARVGFVGTAAGNLPGREGSSRLICLDVGRAQGKLIWEVEATSIDAEGGRWSFEGAPVVQGSRLYVGLRRQQPQAQSNVACFDADSGKLVWNRRICAAAGMLQHDQREVSQQLVTLAENTLYYSTNLGAIVALDPADGTIRWVSTYERSELDEAQAVLAHLQRGLTPCVFHEGTVYVAPADGRQVIALDAASGLRKWSRDFPRQVQFLLGVGQGNLFASGDKLWALDVESGRDGWPEGPIGGHDPEAYGYGRGLLAEDYVYWPRHDEILIVHQRTRAIQPAPLQFKQQTGGNLAIADGFLLIAQPHQLVALCEYSRMRQQLKDEVAAHPDAAYSWLQLARLEQADHKLEDALLAAREALLKAPADEDWEGAPAREVAARELFPLLVHFGETAFAAGEFAIAERFLDEARGSAPSGVETVSALLRLAAARESQGQAATAVDAYQAVLSQPEWRTLQVTTPGKRHQRAETLAAGHISRLLAGQSRELYEPFERAAAARVETARREADPRALDEIIRQFPHAAASRAALLQLAREQSAQGELHRASATYGRLLELIPGDEKSATPAEGAAAAARPLRAAAWEGLARTAERRQHWRSAARAWRALAEEFPDATIFDKPQPVPARQFVALRLARSAFRIEPPAPGRELPLPWSPGWQRPLDSAATWISPEGTPPSPEAPCVLVNQRGVECVTLSSGAIRWTLALNSPVTWTAFQGDNLVLGTPHELRAVDPETGATVWNRKLLTGMAASPPERRQSAAALITGSTSATILRSPVQVELNTGPWAADGEWQSFAVHGELLIGLQGHDRVRAFDGGGNLLPDCPRLTHGPEPAWLCGPDRLRVARSPTGRLTVLAGSSLAEKSPRTCIQPGDGPVALTGGEVAEVTAAGEVVGWAGEQQRWTYRGPLSHANAPPVLLSNGACLLLVSDGDTLIRLNPRSGERIWSRSLGPDPVLACRQRAGCDAERLYVASGGVLRAFRLETGDLAWERFLGDRQALWKAVAVDTYVIAFPEQGPAKSTASVLVCESATGRPVQRSLFPETRRLQLRPDSETTLIATDTLLVGLRVGLGE